MIFVIRERPLPHVFCYPSERTGTIDAEAAEHGNAQGIDRGYWQALSHQQSPAEAADPGGIYASHRVPSKARHSCAQWRGNNVAAETKARPYLRRSGPPGADHSVGGG